MKNTLLTRLLIGITLFTGVSLFAQAADNTVLTEVAPHVLAHEHIQLHQNKQDEGDIESERETKEFDSLQLQEITNDRRFTGRQFNLHKKEK